MTSTEGLWVHMVGIAGAGMSGIAQILSAQGNKISGSDLQKNGITTKLEALGIEIYPGHFASNIKEGVDLLVISSAISPDNIEVIRAKELNIPVIKRGKMLANLVNRRKGIAVAGAHGKTTTTSMIYTVLSESGLDPTFIVGGELQKSNLNAKLGTSDYFVAEADESDASFLDLKPHAAVITNIEDDHLDFYKSLDNLKKAFKDFIAGVSNDGLVIVYGADNGIREIIDPIQKKILLYGEDEEYDYYFNNWSVKGLGSVFDVYKQGNKIGSIELAVPGKHNALNGLAAIAVALELGVDFASIKEAILKFRGIKRRFEIIGKWNGITLVDDYAHHPTEIRATLNAAKNMHSGRIITIFQPHRYSRTQSLGKELGEAFLKSDLAIFTEVYAAGEAIIPGVNGINVCEAAKKAGCNTEYIAEFKNIVEYLRENVQSGDLIITMGAGDIWKVGVEVLNNRLEKTHS